MARERTLGSAFTDMTALMAQAKDMVQLAEHFTHALHKGQGQGQGLTLVHFSAQSEPFLTLNTSPKRLSTPSTTALHTPKSPPKYPLPPLKRLS